MTRSLPFRVWCSLLWYYATRRSSEALISPQVQQAASNLLSICGHLQDENLYSAQWADGLRIIASTDAGTGTSTGTASTITASRKLRQGDILSLFPVQVLRVQDHETQQAQVFSLGAGLPQEKQQQQRRRRRPHHQPTPCEIPVNLHCDPPLPIWNVDQHELFVDVDESSPPLSNKEGWRAHLVERRRGSNNSNSRNESSSSLSSSASTAANCQIISLPGAVPLCALVATKTIKKGVKLVMDTPTARQEEETTTTTTTSSLLANLVSKRYAMELAELRRTLNLAYSTIQGPARTTTTNDDKYPISNDEFQYPFHEIDLDYPGLRNLHTDPNIHVVDNFLTREETELLKDYARPNLRPCQAVITSTGTVSVDESRTSWDANVPQRHVPWLVEKMTSLTKCRPEQLETFQVLHYGPGQQFQPHTDGFPGPATACGFENSGRLVTIFCYLNDCSSGGETHFPEILTSFDNNNNNHDDADDDENHDDVMTTLMIRPQCGMAVLHFPTTMGLEEDPRTLHAGLPPNNGEEKWLLVTWVWRDAKSNDPRFDESVLLFPDERTTSSYR